MINPLSFAVDCVRAALAIPKIIVRLPAMVDKLDHFSAVTMPALVAGAEPMGRASLPLVEAMARAGFASPDLAQADQGHSDATDPPVV